MVTAAKNSITHNSPHYSALTSRKTLTQSHPCRSNSTGRWNRARYYHAELGRFISRDPIGYVGGISLYRAYFVPGMVDPTGLDRYITQFGAFDGILGDPNGGIIIDQLHMGIAVDTWRCDKDNGRWVKTGAKTFHFAVKVDYGAGLLGVICYRGKVSKNEGIHLGEYLTIESSPCQDIALLKELDSQYESPLVYSAVFHNCINWTSRFIKYGMDEPAGKECDKLCECDLPPRPRLPSGPTGPTIDVNGKCMKECMEKMENIRREQGREPTSGEFIECLHECKKRNG